MQTQTIGIGNIHNGSWSASRIPDPFSYGLGAFFTHDIDTREYERLNEKRRKTTNIKINLMRERMYRICEYMYFHGEMKSADAGKMAKTSSTHIKDLLSNEIFLYGGETWVVYEDDTGRTIGIVNKYGQTPQECKNE